jgi:hypothetical protein
VFFMILLLKDMAKERRLPEMRNSTYAHLSLRKQIVYHKLSLLNQTRELKLMHQLLKSVHHWGHNVDQFLSQFVTGDRKVASS